MVIYIMLVAFSGRSCNKDTFISELKSIKSRKKSYRDYEALSHVNPL